MKGLLSFVIAALAISFPATAAVNAKQPYFRPSRPSQSQAVRPHQGGEPVALNAASFEPGVSPGGLATIFGNDLTSVNGVVIAPSLPLPSVLAGVTVVIDGVAAPIYSIAYANGEDQISVQVPYDTPIGPAAARIQVFDHGSVTADFVADSFTEDPGIFVYKDNYALAVHASDNSLVGPDDPAAAGEVLVLYVTALGPLSIPLEDGFPAPSLPLAYTIEPFQVLVDGEASEVFFSGLAPGFDGVYQINFRVPRNARSGSLSLQIQSPFASSRVVTLPVF